MSTQRISSDDIFDEFLDIDQVDNTRSRRLLRAVKGAGGLNKVARQADMDPSTLRRACKVQPGETRNLRSTVDQFERVARVVGYDSLEEMWEVLDAGQERRAAKTNGLEKELQLLKQELKETREELQRLDRRVRGLSRGL